jgi:hypothetical protein
MKYNNKMLKILNFSSKSIKYPLFFDNKRRISNLSLKYKFSTIKSDPYYILGIEKGIKFNFK